MCRILLTAAVLGSAACAQAEQTETIDEGAIRTAVEAATDSAFMTVSNLSIDAFLALASDEPIADGGRLRTVDDIRTSVGQEYSGLTSLAFDHERTLTYVLGSDAAIVVSEGPYRWVTREGVTSEGRGAWTFVWQRQSRAWRLLHFHQSIANPAVP